MALTIGLALPAAGLAQAPTPTGSGGGANDRTNPTAAKRKLQTLPAVVNRRTAVFTMRATGTRNMNVNVNADASTGASNQTSFPTTRDPGVRRHSLNSLGREL
jgi:hypothetical protein